MREYLILIVIAISSLFILGYSVHMFIGGLVSAQTERLIISIVCSIGAIVLVFLGLDIVRHRRR